MSEITLEAIAKPDPRAHIGETSRQLRLYNAILVTIWSSVVKNHH